jgi:hypothetical protein
MASERGSRWLRGWPWPSLALELFLLTNLAGLAPDIYLAHSMNDFRRPQEYIPLYFSLAAPAVLLLAILARWLVGAVKVWEVLGHVVGWAAVAVGVAGTVLHLQSRFFEELTLHSLVYSAPFAAPLAYSGMGLLLVMNRLTDPLSAEWARWVLLFTLGGFVGNFTFSLMDHAANGFYDDTEWIAVGAAALAVAFLVMPLVMHVDRGYLAVTAAVMLLQGAVGLLGFWYHFQADWHGEMPTLFGNFVHGAPVLAPMLFADLMLLAWLALATLARHVEEKAHGAALHG